MSVAGAARPRPAPMSRAAWTPPRALGHNPRMATSCGSAITTVTIHRAPVLTLWAATGVLDLKQLRALAKR